MVVKKPGKKKACRKPNVSLQDFFFHWLENRTSSWILPTKITFIQAHKTEPSPGHIASLLKHLLMTSVQSFLPEVVPFGSLNGLKVMKRPQ